MKTKTINQEIKFVDKKLVDKISLWSLRIIFKLGTSSEFIDNYDNFNTESLARFLGLGAYVEMDNFKRSDILENLRKKLLKLENKKVTTSKLLHKNIKKLSKLSSTVE